MPTFSASTTLRPEEREEAMGSGPGARGTARGQPGAGGAIERVGSDAPRGPRVTPTASATMSMPSWIFIRDFMSKVSCLASARTLRVAPRTRTAREARAVVALPARAWQIGWGGMGMEGLAAAPWKL